MTQAVVRIVRPPVDPEKARAAREEAVRRTVAFQMKRAEEGSESAQYELGLRYLKGDGVERDEAKGRHWLGLSAKNGYGPATRKLEDLDKPAEPAPAPAP
jgi:TPR repeat protein